MIDKNETLDIISWKDGSIEQISKMLDAHYKGNINISDYWKIGDSRLESISRIPSGTVREEQPDQVIELVIIGMNHDNLASPIGDISKSAITVQPKNCLSARGNITSDYRNPFYALWSSKRRDWCNEEFYNALSTLKGLVKPVIKLTNIYSYSNEAYLQQKVYKDYAFLLSQWEIWGEQRVDPRAGILPADGTQYEYMKMRSNRVKDMSWWTRTPIIDMGDHVAFSYVGEPHGDFLYPAGGDLYSYGGGSGIAPAFCL